jgi:carboxymethylenebutenolidase
MNKNTILIIMLSAVLFAGCADESTEPTATPGPTSTPVSTPTGHEQAGEPNMSYLGLADVFDGMTEVNVTASNVQIGTDGTEFTAFLARPVAEGPYPGIIMIHEWWGLNDQVRSMAHVLAGEGYVVLAVDLFNGSVATTTEGALANLRDNPNNITVPKMQAAVEYLKEMPDVDPAKIASLGWCYGGGQSFQLGINEELQGVVIYYGRISTNSTELMELKEPVLGLFGEEDISIPAEDVREFERLLKAQGTSADIHIYEGAGHAFANPTNTQAFRKEQAMDAWNKTLDFLDQNLR